MRSTTLYSFPTQRQAHIIIHVDALISYLQFVRLKAEDERRFTRVATITSPSFNACLPRFILRAYDAARTSWLHNSSWSDLLITIFELIIVKKIEIGSKTGWFWKKKEHWIERITDYPSAMEVLTLIGCTILLRILFYKQQKDNL